MGRSLLLLLLALALTALTAGTVSAGVRQPCRASGTSITTEATYADLVTAGCTSDGDIGYTEDEDLYWVCNGATGLWLPPDVQPASIDIVDYTADALPADSTPAWTRVVSGADQSEAVAGGELTLTDGGAGYSYYTLSSDSITSANNVGFIARMKLTATDATTDVVKVWMALFPYSGTVGIYSFSLGMSADGLSRSNAVGIVGASSIYSNPNDSPDNAAYQWYLLTWNADTNMFSMRALGDGPIWSMTKTYFGTTIPIAAKLAAFGTYSTNRTVTSVWDRVMVFTF